MCAYPRIAPVYIKIMMYPSFQNLHKYLRLTPDLRETMPESANSRKPICRPGTTGTVILFRNFANDFWNFANDFLTQTFRSRNTPKKMKDIIWIGVFEMRRWEIERNITRYWFSVTLSLTYKYIYVGQWPMFCGTVILPYMFNTIWWTSLILWQVALALDIGSNMGHYILWLSDFKSFTYFCLLWC